MNGTLQIVVNLRSPSVEYSSEKGENRYSRTLKGDTLTSEGIVNGITDAFEGESDLDKITRVVHDTLELANNIGDVNHLSFSRGGNVVSVHPDDISFVTIKLTGELTSLIP